VVKHAGVGAACKVEVYYGAIVLGVRVTDNGGGRQAEYAPAVLIAGPGHGIIGMRERAHLCGGEFEAGPLADGGFAVAVTLPVPVPDDSVVAGRMVAGPVADTTVRADGTGHDDQAAAARAVGARSAEGQR
jgi:signal transduction histidine kinase